MRGGGRVSIVLKGRGAILTFEKLFTTRSLTNVGLSPVQSGLLLLGWPLWADIAERPLQLRLPPPVSVTLSKVSIVLLRIGTQQNSITIH